MENYTIEEGIVTARIVARCEQGEHDGSKQGFLLQRTLPQGAVLAS